MNWCPQPGAYFARDDGNGFTSATMGIWQANHPLDIREATRLAAHVASKFFRDGHVSGVKDDVKIRGVLLQGAYNRGARCRMEFRWSQIRSSAWVFKDGFLKALIVALSDNRQAFPVRTPRIFSSEIDGDAIALE